MSADVELDHVTVRFGDFVAVKDATLKIRGGEFFSFLGPSGCGKTTILRMISGFIEPERGRGPHRRAGHARHRPQQAADRADLPEPARCSR